jgi:hypothetical protein
MDPGLGQFHQPSRAFPVMSNASWRTGLRRTSQLLEQRNGRSTLRARTRPASLRGAQQDDLSVGVVNMAARHQAFGRTLKRRKAGTGPNRSALGVPDARKRGFVGDVHYVTSLCNNTGRRDVMARWGRGFGTAFTLILGGRCRR